MTAVELLRSKMLIECLEPSDELFEQAKKMEKKQIMEAWLTAKPITFNGWKNEFEKYYNEKFIK